MEYTSLIDTSLDLSIKPLQLLDDGVKQEVQSNLPELGTKVPVKEEADALVDELNRVSAENKKLTEMLTVLCENYTALRSQLMDYMSKNPGIDNNTGSKKRKAESTTTNNNNNTIIDATNEPSESRESSSSDEGSCKKPREEHFKAKTSKVYYRTEPSDTGLIVKDGYQWRKYGQKVTRDNPSPRAYFKCSFAPSCPVKKKVQRSVEDQSILVATYEGEHNHPHPSKMETPASNSSRSVTLGSVPCSTTLSSSGVPTVALDLTNPKSHEEVRSSSSHRVDSPELQQFFIQHMASSLTKDPTFKAALAAAISGKFLQHNQTEKW